MASLNQNYLIFERSMMRHHMGAHVLQPSWTQYSCDKPRMSCGLCGIRRSAGQHLVSPNAMPGSCGVSLSKAKNPQPVHQCHSVGALQYSISPAGKCTPSAPCTNRPLRCPKCPLVMWSYSMQNHFEDDHPSAEIPAPAATAAKISLAFHEAELVSQLLSAPKAKAVCKGATCVCQNCVP